MRKFQPKKKYRKQFMSVLMSAALVMQNGVPVLAENESQLGAEDETEEATVEKAAAEDSNSEESAEDHSEEKSSTEESSAEEKSSTEERSDEENSTTEESSTKESSSEENSSAEESSSDEKSSAEESSSEEKISTEESSSEENSSVEESSTEETTETESSTEESSTEETTEEEEEKNLAESTNAEGGNVLKNGSFESTTTATGKYWKNDIVPTDYNGIWRATPGTGGMSFAIEDSAEAKDGGKVFHISSTDNTARWDLAQPSIAIDGTKEYECTFWVKTENVTGTGMYMVLKRMVPGDGTKETISSDKFTGSTDGWVQYRFTTETLPLEAGNTLQLDIFGEYMTGDVWVDDIRITPIDNGTSEGETITLNKTTLTLTPEKTHQLKVTGADGEEITWASSDEMIATVDNTGLVTAVAIGETEITATVKGKNLTCKVIVKAPVEGETVIFSDDFEGELGTSRTVLHAFP